ncbi:MAG: hypothetical protein PHG02_10285, partial [Oscillospiraceae bacterium]|nr:hypothetical protein [Oscillospiraceae bacterium]
MENFILYFYLENEMFEYPLPAVDNRKILIEVLRQNKSNASACLQLEIWDGTWHIVSNEDVA